MTTPVWLTGFEYGLATLVTSGAGLTDVISGTELAVQTAVKRSGSYALQVNPAGLTQTRILRALATPTYVVGRVYIRFGTLPSPEDTAFIWATSTAGVGFAINVEGTAAHRIYARVEGGTVQYGPEIVVDTWYRVDMKGYCNHATTQTLDWQVDGVSQTQATLVTAATTFTFFVIGNNGNNSANTYFDDIIVSTTSSDYPIGAGLIEGLRPSADGTHDNAANIMEDVDGNDIDGITYMAFDKLDESPWISTANADYVRQTDIGAANYCEIVFPDTAYSRITGVVALLQYASASTSANTGGCIIIDEDATLTTVWGVAGALADYSETSAFYKFKVLPTPAGGWDAAAVNALKCRFGYSDDADPDVYWLAIMLEVSVATAPIGSVCWGHVTGVTEANTRAFAGNWTGTGDISSSGDGETIDINAGEYMESEVVNTGIKTVELDQNHYDITGDTVKLEYRHGATIVDCEAAGWNDYTIPFLSLGFVQVRIESTL